METPKSQIHPAVIASNQLAIAKSIDLTQEQYIRNLEDKLTEKDSVIAALRANVEMNENVKEWLNEDIEVAERQAEQLQVFNENISLAYRKVCDELAVACRNVESSDIYVASLMLRLNSKT